MSFATTSAPSAANRRAMPPPMPAAAPVITAILSSSSPMAADPTCRGSSDRRRTRRARECVAFEPSTGGSKLVTRTESSAQGGLARWAPRVTPPIGVDLTPEQALACAFRILAGIGFSENVGGHITYVDGTRRFDARQSVGPVVGGDRGLRPVSRRQPTVCRSPDAGTSRPRSTSTPSSTASPPTRASSSTTIRTTRRSSPRSARSRRCCTRPRRCSTATCASSTSTTVRSTTRRRARNWLARSAADGVAILANHGVIVTGPSLARGDVPRREPRTDVPPHL